jgi:hypothetical protein
VAQWLAQDPYTVEVMGSSPILTTKKRNMKNKNSEKYKKFLESEWYKKHSEKTPKHLIRTTEEKNKIYKMNKILKVKSHFFHNL